MLLRIFSLLLAAALLVACGGQGGQAGAPQAARAVTMAMPYIPNVQFAHFYVADRKGYYAAEGLKVTFDYNFETDVVQRTAQGTVHFGAASGDSVLLARAQGLPVVTVATTSQRFPVVFYSKQAAGITRPEDMRGKSVGIPGRFGASYIGLQALLYASKIPEADLNVQEIGFAQVAALAEDKVQVASGYGNNEPVQLAQQGIPVNVIRVADYFPLASDGIIVSEKLIAEQPEVVRGFVRATLRGMQDTIANPDEAFQISLEYIPELKQADEATRQLQRTVLQETLPYWQSEQTAEQGLGFTDEASWRATHTFLRDSGLLKQDVDISQAFTNHFIK
ncbi:MAG TPA: ABC transporter substrate-binding protein [Roseiflexaceae bacterium]|nr:ABC transporter substrate-binding protein [Roseiflexaceae bacterium]